MAQADVPGIPAREQHQHFRHGHRTAGGRVRRGDARAPDRAAGETASGKTDTTDPSGAGRMTRSAASSYRSDPHSNRKSRVFSHFNSECALTWKGFKLMPIAWKLQGIVMLLIAIIMVAILWCEVAHELKNKSNCQQSYTESATPTPKEGAEL
jgi:hypothetical protein